MNRATESKLVVAGVALILCLPVFAAVAGLYCYFTPRQYYAETTIEFRRSSPDDLRKAFHTAVLPFQQSAEFREVRNTALYEIGVYDLDPQQAANRANTTAATLQQQLGSEDQLRVTGPEPDPRPAAIESQMRGPVIKIWERAEPPVNPSRPNVPAVMLLGLAPGLLLAGVGGVLLLIAFLSRQRDARTFPQPIA